MLHAVAYRVANSVISVTIIGSSPDSQAASNTIVKDDAMNTSLIFLFRFMIIWFSPKFGFHQLQPFKVLEKYCL